MNQLTEFDKEQIRICREHIKNAKSDHEKQDWENWLNEYVNCLKVHYSIEVKEE